MNAWTLPTFAEIKGVKCDFNTDYRDILEIIDILNDREKNPKLRHYLALALFYEDIESVPDLEEAAHVMSDFISMCDEDNTEHPKQIDWTQDAQIIVSDVNKVAGYEVRSVPYLHWWTFLAYFNAIGEGQLSYIVSLREKLRKRKPLDAHEREFYKKNRARVDFKQALTQKEEDTLRKWIKKG